MMAGAFAFFLFALVRLLSVVQYYRLLSLFLSFLSPLYFSDSRKLCCAFALFTRIVSLCFFRTSLLFAVVEAEWKFAFFDVDARVSTLQQLAVKGLHGTVVPQQYGSTVGNGDFHGEKKE